MAGILAQSASVTTTSGQTSVDNTFTGFVTGERITLSTSPTGTDYSWGQSIPSASAQARSELSSLTAAAPTFTPDVAGTYVVTVDVDGTDYVLRLTVQAASIAEPVEAVRYSPRGDATIPAPAAGFSVYYSSTQSGLLAKDPDGQLVPIAAPSAAYSYRQQGATPTLPTTVDTWHALAIDAVALHAGAQWTEADGLLTSVNLGGLFRAECEATISVSGGTGNVQLVIDLADSLRATTDAALFAGLALVDAAVPGGIQIKTSRLVTIGDGVTLQPLFRHDNAGVTFTVQRVVMTVHPV